MSNPCSSDPAVRVLVVEDNEDDRDLLLRQLRQSGLDSHIKFISDGKEALRFLTRLDEETLADKLIAIFLDLQLPSLSGIDLLRNLRERDGFKSVPVIVMTSSNDPGDLEECRRLKVTNYIAKPITLTSFSKAVADVFHLPRRAGDAPLAEEN